MSELVALPPSAPAAVELPVDTAALDRLPGGSDADPFLRLAAAYPANSARAYRTDLRAWATWCGSLGVHSLAARRHHADAWIRHLTTAAQPRTGRPASAATVARRLSGLAHFYDYAIHDAEVITYSPVANVRRPSVSDDSATVGLSANELRQLLATATGHSPRMGALVGLPVLNGLRISEALAADIRDYGHDRGHRVLRVVRKGGKAARVPLAPPVVRALDCWAAGFVALRRAGQRWSRLVAYMASSASRTTCWWACAGSVPPSTRPIPMLMVRKIVVSSTINGLWRALRSRSTRSSA